MMKEIDECTGGCPQGCINCGRKHIQIKVCDWCECEDEYERYYNIGNDEVCEECAIEYIKDNPSDFLECLC